MFVARALVFGVTARAVLAVAGVAMAVVYALTAGGAASGLEGKGATFEGAAADPGHLVHDEGFASFIPPAGLAPRAVVDWVEVGKDRVATVRPWPSDNLTPVLGPYAGLTPESPIAQAFAVPADATPGVVPYAPPDALVVDPARFEAEYGRGDTARWVYVAGDAPHEPGLRSVPWRGVAPFFDEGAAQVSSGLLGVVLLTGLVAALLASGMVYLEVMARRRDLETLRALGGRRRVQGLVVARVAVLIASGVLVGTVGGLLALRVAEAAIGGSFAVPPWVLVATWLSVGAGAFTAGSAAGLRALRHDARMHGGTAAIPVRRFPGPLRFLLVTPRASAAVFSAVFVTGMILAVVLHTAAIPDQVFQTGGKDEYVTDGQGNPLRTETDRFLSENLRFLDEVERSMPITFVPTVVKGDPVMVKGTSFEAWADYAGPRLVRGSWPAAAAEASVGVRAARLLDVGIGDEVVVPSSYTFGAALLRVTAVHATGGLEDDEIFTDLGTAGMLAGIGPTRVHGAHVRLAPDVAEAPRPGGIVVGRLRLDPAEPLPLASATASVDVLNFAATRGVRDLELRVNGLLLNATRVALDAHSVQTVRLGFVVPAEPLVRLEINPEAEYATGRPTLEVAVPDVARPGVPFTVVVTDLDGAVVPGASVAADGVAAGDTDAQGEASVTVGRARLSALTATAGDRFGSASVRVAPTEWDETAQMQAERIVVRAPRWLDDARFAVDVEATVVNLGGVDGVVPMEWSVDGIATGNETVAIASGGRRAVTTTLEAEYGTRQISFGGAERSLTVLAPDVAAPPEPGGEDAPTIVRTVDDVLDEKRRALAQGSPGDRTRSFLEQVFEAFEEVTVVVVLVTFLHGGALVWLAVVREVRERMGVLMLLGDLGADSQSIQGRVVRDALLATAPAAAAGALAAGGALALGRYLGFPMAFGHALPPASSADVLVRTALALLAVAAVGGVYAARRPPRVQQAAASRRPIRDWMEGR